MPSLDIFEDKWKDLRSQIRPRWTSLSDDDVARIDGKVDVLIELLQEKYGFTQAQAEAEVNRLLQDNDVAVPMSRN